MQSDMLLKGEMSVSKEIANVAFSLWNRCDSVSWEEFLKLSKMDIGRQVIRFLAMNFRKP